jgi:hypothetical protein
VLHLSPKFLKAKKKLRLEPKHHMPSTKQMHQTATTASVRAVSSLEKKSWFIFDQES